MHVATFILYGAFITAELGVLALLQATGNFYGLFPASLWFLVDLAVALTSMIVAQDAAYRAVILPRLVLFHSAAFAVCLVWMGLDAWRGAHPLAGIFFAAMATMAAARLLEYLLIRFVPHPMPWVLLIQTVAVCGLTAFMVAALLLPIPPTPATARSLAPAATAPWAPAAACARRAA